MADVDPDFEQKLPGYGRIREVVAIRFDVDREEDIDPDVIWTVGTTIVPGLRPRLQALLDGSDA